jgi:peptidoglycan/LPS O-acetylase OafA/YrhL
MSNHPMKKDHIDPYIGMDFLDSLRFFAIVYVVISHLRVIPQPNLMIPEWIASVIINHLSADLSAFLVPLLITLIPLTVISLISYKYIEHPGISWREKLIRRRWPINRLDRERKSH